MQVKPITKTCKIQKNECDFGTVRIGKVSPDEVGKLAVLVDQANEALATVAANLDVPAEAISISRVVELGLQTASERKVRKMYRENLIANGVIEGSTGGATSEPEAFEEI